MKLISWNVNGLRACISKGFEDFLNDSGADIVCIQETKMQPDQAQVNVPGYHVYFNSAEKKGYSGTAVFSREEPLSISYGMGIPEHDTEGRIICAEFDDFYLVNVYTPNSQRELARIDYRMEWEDSFREYVLSLDKVKPVVICGDLNVAFSEIDLKNPKNNINNAGFTQKERDKLSLLLESGFCDSFRFFYPDKTGAYSWWSYMYNARKNNAGWRIDYFLVSNKLKKRMKDADIYPDVLGSDHCPVMLELE